MNPWKISTIVLAAVLGSTLALGTLHADRQPLMRAALGHLEQAKDALQKADNDKGGHRVKALQLVNEAIDQVKEGIKHDNRN